MSTPGDHGLTSESCSSNMAQEPSPVGWGGGQFSEKRVNEWKIVCGEAVRGKRDVWVLSSF